LDPRGSQLVEIARAECDQASRRATVCFRPAAVGVVKIEPVSQEQDSGRVLPAWLEASGFGARVKKRGSVAVLRQFLDPLADCVSIERRIEKDAATTA
jgi:hypothetical protein